MIGGFEMKKPIGILMIIAILITVFIVNLEGSWFGGKASTGQFVLTIAYIVFWLIFSWILRKEYLLQKWSCMIGSISFVSALYSTICGYFDFGGFISGLIAFPSGVPFYGLRAYLDWDTTYHVAAVITFVWTIITFVNLKKYYYAAKVTE